MCFSPTVLRVSSHPLRLPPQGINARAFGGGHRVRPAASATSSSCSFCLRRPSSTVTVPDAHRDPVLPRCSCSHAMREKGVTSVTGTAPAAPPTAPRFSERPECDGASKQAHSGDREALFGHAVSRGHQSLLFWALQPGLSQNMLSGYLPALLLTCNSAAKDASALVYLSPCCSFFLQNNGTYFLLATVRSLRKTNIQIVTEYENL